MGFFQVSFSPIIKIFIAVWNILIFSTLIKFVQQNQKTMTSKHSLNHLHIKDGFGIRLGFLFTE